MTDKKDIQLRDAFEAGDIGLLEALEMARCDEISKRQVPSFKWSEITLGELGVLSQDYEIEIDGDAKVVRVIEKQTTNHCHKCNIVLDSFCGNCRAKGANK